VRVAESAPALFTANSDGRGAPVALALRVDTEGRQSPVPVIACGAAAGSCTAAPLPVAGGDLYISFFGTGTRARRTQRLTIADLEVPLTYIGAQGQYAGFDQINAGPLPAALAGKGTVEAILTLDGQRSNAVTLRMD